MKKVLPIILPLLAGLVLGYFARLPYLGVEALSEDSVKDVNVAHNILTGRGLTLSLKWSYYPETPLVRPSVGERGIVYPYLLAGALKHKVRLDVINLVLSLLAVVLFFNLIRLTLDSTTAWLSIIWLIFLPGFCLAGSFLWNLPLLLCLVLVTGLVLARSDSPYGFALAGAVLGFTFWVEPWFIFSVLAFLPGIAMVAGNGKEAFFRALIFLGGFLFICLPLLYLGFAARGQVLPIHIPVHFQVKDYQQFLEQSYGAQVPSARAFLTGNWKYAASRVLKNLGLYLKAGFWNNGSWLFLLGGLGFVLSPKTVLKNFPKKYIPLLGFSVLCLFGSALVWSRSWPVETPVFVALFVMPLLFFLSARVRFGGQPVGLMVLVLLAAFGFNAYKDYSYREINRHVRRADLKVLSRPTHPLEKWVINNKDTAANLGATKPWKIYTLTLIDTGAIPVDIPPGKLCEFARKFGYNYLINNDLGAGGFKFRNRIIQQPTPGLEKIREDVWKLKDEQNGL